MNYYTRLVDFSLNNNIS